ncbi:unnamed protein product, partial [Mesorhabditis spiculigera]
MRLSKRNVLINVLLALFVFISFYLYGVFDAVTDEKRTELLRHQSELRKLKSQVHSLEKKLRGNAEAMRTIREELANSEQQRKNQEIQKDNAIALAIENADNVLEGKLNAEMQDEDSRDAGEGAAQLPIPRNKVAIVHEALTGLSRREQCSAMLNYSSAKTDVQMLDMYKIIPFDNIDGGVWKQGWELKYDANEVKKEKPLEVFVIPHSHCDPGWIMTFEDYYQQRTKNILNGMVKHLSEKPGMKFIYAEMSFFEMWWAEQSEGTRQKVREHLKSGQLEIVTGGWVMTDEANAHYHSIITELFEGHEFLQNNIGKEFLPKSHWSIDPFGLSPSLPLLLSEANITDAVLQRVHYSVKKKLSETKQLEFMWRQLWGGSDARHDVRSHLFPFYSYDVPHTCGPEPKVCCQFDFKRLPGGGVTCDWGVPPQSINSKNVEQRAFMIYDQYRKKSQLFKTNVLLIPLGDDFRYQDDFEWNNQHDNYKQLFDYMNAKTEWNVKARFGTLADYFDALDASLKEDQQQLPVLSGDFFTYADRDDHYWSGYFTSRPFYKHMDRILQHYLRTAEIAYSLAQIDGGNLDDEVLPKLVEVRRALSLFQHHDGVTGTAKDAVVNDYGEKMLSALKRAEEVTTTSIASLLDKSTQISMSFDEFRAKQDSLPEARIFEADSSLLLFNTLAHSRAEVACIQVASPNIRIKRSDGTTPEQQLAPVLVHRDGRIQAQMGRFELCFWAEIGALASEVFTLYSKDEQSAAELVLVKGSAKPASLDHFFKFEQSSGSVELANTLVTAVFSGVTGFLKEIRLASGEKMDVNAHFVKYGARPHGSLRNGGGDNLSGAYVFLPDGQARPLEVTQPSFVVTEGPLMKRILATGPNDGKLNQLYSLEKESYSIGIRNTIDLSNRPDNIEVALRFETNIANGEDLFTDLNDLQDKLRLCWIAERNKMITEGSSSP